ncbi:DUF4381 domain-containing protein [Halochromatium roseum]|uniref:DUF4381 domain-containing protein n=1 Tax=Halochromatium roseum TaxID=391920 RepID=UPI001911D1D6|nr:DUF4381 domain-containing protein [Halochromatium roseum]MBK5940694.1 hypothetical protein [Halochromatium roseum]
MNTDLRTLRDIHDALGNPWWPLAPGWWLLFAMVVGVVAFVWHFRQVRWVLPVIPLLYLGDWRWDARRALKRLRCAPPQTSLKTQLAELSELLKRVAMARHGRSACAGLHGQAWLDWLSAHDPDGFNWRQHGQLIVSAPYAPDSADPAKKTPGSSRDRDPRSEPPPIADRQHAERQLEQLIAATERWITAPLKAPKRGAESTQGTSAERADNKSDTALSLFSRAPGWLTSRYHKVAKAFRQHKPPAAETTR